MPECLRIITKTDPGMPDEVIRMSAELIGFSCLLSALGPAAALSKGTIWNPWVLGMGVIGPGCSMSLTWLVLVLSKRRRLRTTSHKLGIKDGYHTPHPTLQDGRNVDLERTIGVVWADGW